MTDAATLSRRQAGEQARLCALDRTLSAAPGASGQPLPLSITVALIPELVQSAAIHPSMRLTAVRWDCVIRSSIAVQPSTAKIIQPLDRVKGMAG